MLRFSSYCRTNNNRLKPGSLVAVSDKAAVRAANSMAYSLRAAMLHASASLGLNQSTNNPIPKYARSVARSHDSTYILNRLFTRSCAHAARLHRRGDLVLHSRRLREMRRSRPAGQRRVQRNFSHRTRGAGREHCQRLSLSETQWLQPQTPIPRSLKLMQTS